MERYTVVVYCTLTQCNLRQATFPNRYTTQPVPMLIHGCSGIRRTGVFALAYLFSKQV